MRNVEIEQSNIMAASEWLRHLRDIRNQEAAHLAQAMRQGAPIELLALKASHKYASPHDSMFDGRLMWIELYARKGAQGDRDAVRTAYKQVTWLREHKLPSNSTKSDYLRRVKEFATEVNPHLDQKYAGADLSRLHVEWIPEDLAIDQRMLEREFDKAATWMTPAVVQAELCELFIRCHKTTVHAPEYLSCMDAVAAALCPAVQPAAPLTHAPDTAADVLRARALSGDQEATRLLALMSNQGTGKGKEFKKKKDGKNKNEGKNKNVAGVTRIVGGKLCASGTCHFDHDVKFPRGKSAPVAAPALPPVALSVLPPVAPPARPMSVPHVHIPELPMHARDPDWSPRVLLRQLLLEAYRRGYHVGPVDLNKRPHLSLPNMSPGSQRHEAPFAFSIGHVPSY